MQTGDLQIPSPHIISGPWGGRTFLLDRYGRQLDEVSGTSAINGSLLANGIDESNNRKCVPKESLEIFVDYNELADSSKSLAIAKVVASFASAIQVRCRVVVADGPECWSAFMAFRDHLVSQLAPAGLTAGLVCHGRLRAADEERMSDLFRTGVRLEFAAGYWPGCSVSETCELPEKDVAAYSEFGFAVPVIWYLHQHNIGAADNLMCASLRANHSAGCGIRPVFSHPLFTFDAAEIYRSPTPSEYLDASVRAYEAHSASDHVFHTGVELANALRFGGWNSATGTPAILRLLVINGGIRIFREIPAMSMLWKDQVDASLADGNALESLKRWHYEKMDMSDGHYCSSCQWRMVCGGIDDRIAKEIESVVSAWQDTACAYRMTFLDYFAGIRGSSRPKC